MTSASPVDAGAPGPTAGAPSSQPASAPPAPPEPQTRPCPLCGVANEIQDLFCEACGYDFTTGAAPLVPAAQQRSSLDLDPAPAEPPAVPMPTVVTPAIPAQPPPVLEVTPPPVPMPSAVLAEPAPEPEPAPDAAPASVPADDPTRRRPQYRPPSRESTPDWVVEIWVDPQWYAVQRSDQDCPSPDVPDVVPVHGRTVLVGRPSATRSVRPDVDCGADTGVSRRHAQFSSDGRRWWIEDLGSSNGTYVGAAGDALPVDPIDPGRKVEVDAADRIYLGAWTRLVIRPATASERAGTG